MIKILAKKNNGGIFSVIFCLCVYPTVKSFPPPKDRRFGPKFSDLHAHPTVNSPHTHGLALNMSPENYSASPILEVAPLLLIGNFPMQNFHKEEFPMCQSSFRSGTTFPYREFSIRQSSFSSSNRKFPYVEFPFRKIP